MGKNKINKELLDTLFFNGVDVVNRIVYVSEDSDNAENSLNYNNASKGILYLSKDSKKSIKIIINSPGGGVYEALSLVELIKTIPNKTIGIGMGLVASGASMVLCACSERYLGDNSYIMVHQLSDFLQGTHGSIKNEVKHNESLMNKICKIYADASNKDVKFWKQNLEKDYYIDATLAKELKMIDKVLNNKTRGFVFNKI